MGLVDMGASGVAVGEYRQVPGGWLRIGPHRREEFTPDSLVFTRKSGAKYRHVGRKCSGWPDYFCTDTIQSMESGKYKEMTEGELKVFKTT